MLATNTEIRELATRFITPLYLLDADKIVRALGVLRDALADHYLNSEVTYSVKTNYLSAILRKVLANGYRLEVVSRHELTLAQRNGALSNQLLLNGPVKSEKDLRFRHQHNIALHLDALQEIEAAAAIGTPANASAPACVSQRHSTTVPLADLEFISTTLPP